MYLQIHVFSFHVSESAALSGHIIIYYENKKTLKLILAIKVLSFIVSMLCKVTQQV